MATAKERQIERDRVAEENGKKLDKLISLVEKLIPKGKK